MNEDMSAALKRHMSVPSDPIITSGGRPAKRPHLDATDGDAGQRAAAALGASAASSSTATAPSPTLAVEAAAALSALGHGGGEGSGEASTADAAPLRVSTPATSSTTAGATGKAAAGGHGSSSSSRGSKSNSTGDPRPPPNGGKAAAAVPAAPESKRKSKAASGGGSAGVAEVGFGHGRRTTRGAVPELKRQNDELTASTPVAPPEGWVKASPSALDEDAGAPTSWEGWQPRLCHERVPSYVAAALWQKVHETIHHVGLDARGTPADVAPTLSVGAPPERARPMWAARALLGGAVDASGANGGGCATPPAFRVEAPSVQPNAELPAEGAVRAELTLGELLSSVAGDNSSDFEMDLHALLGDITGEDPAEAAVAEASAAFATATATAAAASSAATAATAAPVAAGGSSLSHPPPALAAAAGPSAASDGAASLLEADGAAYWAHDLRSRLKRLMTLLGDRTPLTFNQLYYLLLGTLAGHVKLLQPHLHPSPGGRTWRKRDLVGANLAHHAHRRAKRIADDFMAAFLQQCKRTARSLRLDVPLAGEAVGLRRAMHALLEVGTYGAYEVMTKAAYNALVGQGEMWAKGEKERLRQELCTRDGEAWITDDFFDQKTDSLNCEVYVLVHYPTRGIVGLAALADFQTPWTAAQFHHCAHACQEDRMFFFGRKSEKDLTPKVYMDMSSSFEGGTRWTSHFHMPTLLAVDIICVKPGTRGLAHILLSHLLCLTSSFTADRTHLLFDISGREKNTRMIKFSAGIGAIRCQCFSDEARSEGYVGVEGDDPSIYWTYKERSGYGPNDGTTAGAYAVDVEVGEVISTEHPAVIFNDRVTLADFHRGGKNCSYFAIAPLDTAQKKLTVLLQQLRAQTLELAAQSAPQRPWEQTAELPGDPSGDPPRDAGNQDAQPPPPPPPQGDKGQQSQPPAPEKPGGQPPHGHEQQHPGASST